MAHPVLYSEPKDMLKSFKVGTVSGCRKAMRACAGLLLLIAAVNPATLHADERHTGTSQLHIQINVMPTLLAAQQAQQATQQPSQSPIAFNLGQSTTPKSNYETQTITIANQNGTTQVAVVETRTTVIE